MGPDEIDENVENDRGRASNQEPPAEWLTRVESGASDEAQAQTEPRQHQAENRDTP